MLILCYCRCRSVRCDGTVCNLSCGCNIFCDFQVLCSSGCQKSACGSFGSSFYGSAVICQNGDVSCIGNGCSGDLCNSLEGIFDLHRNTTHCCAACRRQARSISDQTSISFTEYQRVFCQCQICVGYSCGCTAVYGDFRRCAGTTYQTTGCSCICIGFQIAGFAIRFIVIYIKQCPYSYILSLNLAACNRCQYNRFYCQSGNRRLNRSAYCC